jgi:hypothetical protein
MTLQDSPLYLKQLRQAGRLWRSSILPTTSGGWEVTEEADDRVLRHVHLSDWHRVERARLALSLKALSLEESGWVEA